MNSIACGDYGNITGSSITNILVAQGADWNIPSVDDGPSSMLSKKRKKYVDQSHAEGPAETAAIDGRAFNALVDKSTF